MDFEHNGYSSYFRTKKDSGGLGSPCMSDFQNFRAFMTLEALYVTSNVFFDEIFVIRENISHLVKINPLLYVVMVLDP